MCRACAHSQLTLSRRESDHGHRHTLGAGDRPQKATKGKKDRQLRADLFDLPANTGKAETVFDLWALWRRGLHAEVLVARQDLAHGHPLRTTILAPAEAKEPAIAASKARVGAQEQQMIRGQATAAVASWLTHRQTEMRDAIERRYQPKAWKGKAKRWFWSQPDAWRTAQLAAFDTLRHELHAINAQKAWMVPEATAVNRRLDGGAKSGTGGAKGALVPVSPQARRLARTMFLGLTTRHRWPRFERLAMRLDDRAGVGQGDGKLWIEPSEDAGPFSWWLHLKPTGAETALLLPIRGWGRDRADAFGSRNTGQFRPGVLGNTVNIVEGPDGRLQVALTRDVTEAFREARAAYHPRLEVLGLDFGLKCLFASSEGDLVGRGFMDKIRSLARRADAEAAQMQTMKRKPKESALYCKLVRRLRAMIDCEVNRALNHMVQLHRPRVLAVEKLDFRGVRLGRRMNRLLTNCGRGAVARKLAEFEARLGIVVHQVDPAYTSQTCSSCGYVASTNRKDQTFRCRFCGTRMHADVNGARNIAEAVSGQPVDPETDDGGGRSTLRSGASTSPTGRRQTRTKASTQPRARPRSFTLRDLVRRFDESWPELTTVSARSRKRSLGPGARESAPDPRSANPYWKRFSPLVGRGPKPGGNDEAAAFATAT